MESQNMNGAGEANIFERAVCLSVAIHGLGNRKKVSSAEVRVDTDKEWLHVSKDLLEADSFEAIKTLDAKLKAFLAKRCLPSMFRNGIYLLPVGLIEDVDARLQRYRAERESLVEAFLAEYPRLVDAARDRLKALFDQSDYPSVSRVRGAFSVETQYLTLTTPGKLKGISQALWEREKAKAEAMWVEASVEIKNVLREAMAGLVDHMVGKLTSNPDGKRQVFRDTLIGNMSEFLDTFAQRNITDDGELTALVDKARMLLNGSDANILRSDDYLREKVQAGFSEIKTELDGMLVDRPKRMIDLN